MGTRGPVPKRSTARAGHRAKADRPDQVQAYGLVSVPRAAPGWAPAARRWYTSLSQSAQAKFFEPSDWEYARLLAELLSKQLKARRQSAEMLKAVLSAMDNLGTTEGARRRMRIEIQRAAPADKGEAAKVAVLDRYRKAIDSG